MDYKLFIGIDVTDIDIDEVDDDFDVYVNDGEDFMLLGKMLYDENDITDKLYTPINLTKINNEKNRINKKYGKLGKTQIFIITDGSLNG